MSTPALLLSLFKYKAWANLELFAQVRKLDPATRKDQHHVCLRLLNHVFVVDNIFAAHLSGRTHGYSATNTVETPTLEGLWQAVQALDRWYVDYVNTLAPEQFEESIEFRFTDGSMGCMTREEILAHIATHGGYHRGAVGNILYDADVPPPRDILTAFLHQAEPERRSSKATL